MVRSLHFLRKESAPQGLEAFSLNKKVVIKCKISFLIRIMKIPPMLSTLQEKVHCIIIFVVILLHRRRLAAQVVIATLLSVIVHAVDLHLFDQSVCIMHYG